MRIFRALVTIASVVVIVSGILVLNMHAEMLLLYGPQLAWDFTWASRAGIACAVVASLGVRRLGRRP